MPKYRYLNLEELQELEKEFIEYLILNGITAEDWQKLKSDDPEKADKVIELFSDVVFESIMRKVEYLEYRSCHEIKTFQCLADRLVVVGMKALDDPSIDFNNPGYIQSAITNPPSSLKVYTKEKRYEKQREVELFELTQTGCTITDGKLFKLLCLSL